MARKRRKIKSKLILMVTAFSLMITSCGTDIVSSTLKLKHQYALQNAAFAMPEFQTNEYKFDTAFAHEGYILRGDLEWYLAYYNVENPDVEVTSDDIGNYLIVESQKCPQNIENYICWFEETIGSSELDFIQECYTTYYDFYEKNKNDGMEFISFNSLNKGQKAEIINKYIDNDYEINAEVMREEGEEQETTVKKYETAELTSLLNTKTYEEVKIKGFGISDYDYTTCKRIVSDPTTIILSDVTYNENSKIGSYKALDMSGNEVNFENYPDYFSNYFYLVFITENGYEVLALMDDETSKFRFDEKSGFTDEQLGAVTGIYLLYYGKDGSCQKQLLEVDFEN